MPVFVNDVEISDDAVHCEMQYHPAATVEEAMERAARVLVVKELLLREARARVDLSTLSNASDDDLIDLLLEQVICVSEADAVEAAMRSGSAKPDAVAGSRPVVDSNAVVPDVDYTLRWLAVMQAYINSLVAAAVIVGVTFDRIPRAS
jgi:hypothetical protein